jgi:hypothetical protein
MAKISRHDVLRQIREASEMELYFEIRAGHVDSSRNYQLMMDYGKKRNSLEDMAHSMGIPEADIEEARNEGADRAWDACRDCSDEDWEDW